MLLCVGTIVSLLQAARATRHARAEQNLRLLAEAEESALRHTVYAADMALASQALERNDDETAARF
jgi:hypothetical protein